MTKALEAPETTLYKAVNAMLVALGRDGEIDARHPRVTSVMDAMHALDGGHMRETALEQPDCRLCSSYSSTWRGVGCYMDEPCTDGDKFTPSEPVRLYAQKT